MMRVPRGTQYSPWRPIGPGSCPPGSPRKARRRLRRGHSFPARRLNTMTCCLHSRLHSTRRPRRYLAPRCGRWRTRYSRWRPADLGKYPPGTVHIATQRCRGRRSPARTLSMMTCCYHTRLDSMRRPRSTQALRCGPHRTRCRRWRSADLGTCFPGTAHKQMWRLYRGRRSLGRRLGTMPSLLVRASQLGMGHRIAARSAPTQRYGKSQLRKGYTACQDLRHHRTVHRRMLHSRRL